DRRPAVQDAGGSAGDAGRPVAAGDQPGRAAAAVQRAGGAHEPGGAAALAVPGEPDLRAVAAGTAVGPTGDHGALAGLPGRRSLPGGFSPVDLLRHRVRAALFLLAGSEDP